MTGNTFAGWYSDVALTTVFSFATPITANTTIYAKWTINSYAVTFNSNGGSAVAAQSIAYGSIATQPTAPTLTGNTFAGWYSDVTLTTVFSFTTSITANTTIYAKWTINSYAVTFNGNGGSVVAAQTVAYGGTATQPAVPVMTGYTFAGWYSDAALTTVFSFSTQITANTTLYAKWTINSYSVTFNSNGGSVVVSQAVSYNGTATQPTAPSLLGKTFAGWYSDAALTTIFSFTTSISANTTLYAKWTINSYTVTFISSGGSAVASQTVSYNNSATLPTMPTKTGYTFTGWYSDAVLTTVFSFTTAITANTTLYAKWTINSYTVTFNSNGGSAFAAQSIVYGGIATQPTAPTLTGNTFAGWYTDVVLTTVFSFATPITANTILYAKWTANSYTVTFNSNGGSAVAAQSVVYGSIATVPIAPTITGYTFNGWSSDAALSTEFSFATPITANTTVYAKWTINSYSVIFNSNGGSAVAAQSIIYSGIATQPTAPTLTGNTFAGWYSDAVLTTVFSFATPTTANTTLYAKWTMNANTGFFSATGNMITTRAYHTVTVLSNGNVLIAGGNGQISSAELYDPKTGVFTATGSMTTGRSGHTATKLLNGKVLITGGIDVSGLSASSAELYDPITGTFTATVNMNTAREYHSAIMLLNGKVLITGGISDNGPSSSSAELYDPATGKFTATGSMVSATNGHTSTMLANGMILIINGSNPELYNPETGTFIQTGNTITNRSIPTVTLLSSGKVLITGGAQYKVGILASTELYDPITDSFTATGSMAAARWYHSATMLPDGKVLIAGGVNDNGYVPIAELYDPSTGKFTTTASMVITRAMSQSAPMLTNGKILIAGGQNSNGDLASAELYDQAIGAPVANVAPVSWDFGSIATGTISSPATITVTNNGSVDIVISAAAVSGNFNMGGGSCGTLPKVLPPAGSCTVTATFSPFSLGAYSSNLVIASNDPATPNAVVALSGTGIEIHHTLTLTMEGNGSVNSNPSGFTCSRGSCTSSYLAGTKLTLMTTPSAPANLGAWNGDCAGNTDCQLVMDADKNVTVTFITVPMVKVGPLRYLLLQSAYDSASTTNSATIELQEGFLAGAFTAGRAITVSIIGGYRADVLPADTATDVHGPVVIRAGTVIMEGVSIH